jgi:hypothetical protein
MDNGNQETGRNHNFKDRTGQKYGKLEAKSFAGKSKRGATLWNCLCDCGNITTVLSYSLGSGNTTSCGCLKGINPKTGHGGGFKDISGERFGMLVALGEATKRKNGKIEWNCVCDCGNEKVILASDLSSGNTKSCGCARYLRKSGTPYKDLTGQRFGRLFVQSFAGMVERVTDKLKQATWNCVCDCGSTRIVNSAYLHGKFAHSCGCIRREQQTDRNKSRTYKRGAERGDFIDLSGQRFGKWLVQSFAGSTERHQYKWNCVCDCGTVDEVFQQSLTRKASESCGCSKRDEKWKTYASELNRLEPYKHLHNNLVSAAKKRGIPCDLTYNEFLEFTKIQKCHYCLNKLYWRPFKIKKTSFASNIDRMDSSNGYSKDNCIPCCHACNIGKGERRTYTHWYRMTQPFRTGELTHEQEPDKELPKELLIAA